MQHYRNILSGTDHSHGIGKVLIWEFFEFGVPCWKFGFPEVLVPWGKTLPVPPDIPSVLWIYASAPLLHSVHSLATRSFSKELSGKLWLIILVVNQVTHVGCLKCPALAQVLLSEIILLSKAGWCWEESHPSCRLSICSGLPICWYEEKLAGKGRLLTCTVWGCAGIG